MHSYEAEWKRPQSPRFSLARVWNLFYNLHKLFSLSEPQFPHKFIVRINLDKICKTFGTELGIDLSLIIIFSLSSLPLMLSDSHHCTLSFWANPQTDVLEALNLSNLPFPVCGMGIRTYFTGMLGSSYRYCTGKNVQNPKALCHDWLLLLLQTSLFSWFLPIKKELWAQHKFPGL